MPSSQKIPILNRTLRMLEAVTERGKASAKQLSIDLGIPLATCYRILNTLADARWLKRDAVGDYQLSFGISRLGGLAADMARFFAVSYPLLRQLAEATACSAKISAREGDDWLMLARYEQPHTIKISQQVGSRDCVAVGSVGAVLVRQLSDNEIREILRNNPTPHAHEQDQALFDRVQRCREHNYADDFGVTSENVHAVSIPLCLTPLEESAAITLFGAPEHLPEAKLKEVLKHLRSTAQEIERAFAAN